MPKMKYTAFGLDRDGSAAKSTAAVPEDLGGEGLVLEGSAIGTRQ